MRELMKIMGLSQIAHQLSWFVTAFIVFIWITITGTIVAHYSFLPLTDPGILFVYFFLFTMSEITLCFLISVFFSNSKLAAIVGPTILFVFVLPNYVFYNSTSTENVASKIGASILSPTAFALGAQILSDYEYGGTGVQLSNIGQGGFSFLLVLYMMLADIFVYGVLAWYLDHVLPHEFGTPKHFLFLFDPHYWFPSLATFSCYKTIFTEDSYDGKSLPPGNNALKMNC